MGRVQAGEEGKGKEKATLRLFILEHES